MHLAVRVTLIEADIVVKTFTGERADHPTSERIELTSLGMLEMGPVNHRTLDFPVRLVFLVATGGLFGRPMKGQLSGSWILSRLLRPDLVT